MMQESGFHVGWSLLTSMTVYTGAFQFVLITFFSSGASYLTIALTALFMNSRQLFYGLSFVDDFPKMGRKKMYMIHTMTDETYAVNCSLKQKSDKEAILSDDINRRNIMFYVALFSRISWMIGAVAGGMLGQLLPFELEGIDFCMTALFVVIFLDQWKAYKSHIPAILGISTGVLLLIILGSDRFMLPTVVLVSGILILLRRRLEKNE
jgi:4-azaleucine resistance transporter AzlC